MDECGSSGLKIVAVEVSCLPPGGPRSSGFTRRRRRLEAASNMTDRATLTRLGPDSPSVMEKGSQELEDSLAVERKKVWPSPPYG